MKFKFYGYKDCPEWFLSEVILINKVTAVKIRLIISQLILKIKQSTYDLNKIEKFCKDSSLNPEETQAIIAVLTLIIESYVKYNVEDPEFLKEMLQLGLSQEIAESMISALNKDKASITNELKKQTMRYDKVTGHEYCIQYEHNTTGDGGQITADISISTQKQQLYFTVNKSVLSQLISELRKIEETISKI